jgi:hypothetical protein
MLRRRPVMQLRRTRASSGRPTSLAREGQPTGWPERRSVMVGSWSGSQITSAARPCADCSMRRCVRCPRRVHCGPGRSPGSIANLGEEQRAQARLDVFQTVSRDYAWLMTITLLADVAARVGNPDQVKTLYEPLHPYAAFVAGADYIRFGSVSRYLGLLAAALSRLDDAALLLQEAVETNDRIDAQPWSAHSKADLAQVLLARDAPGDRETAEGLLQKALATYQDLGMASPAARLASVR